jgi:hypothetical protein
VTARTCGQCKFFDERTEDCHRHAPEAFLVATPRGGPVAVGTWPPVKPDTGWCAEYEPDLSRAS